MVHNIGISDETGREVRGGDIVSVGNHYPSLVEKTRGAKWHLHELDPCDKGIYLSLEALTLSPKTWRIIGDSRKDNNLLPTWCFTQ